MIEKPEHLRKTITEFVRVADTQEIKGIEKYGVPLDPFYSIDPKTNKPYDWIQMTIEEIVDAFKYLIAEREKKRIIVNKIRQELKKDIIDKEEILKLLNDLE